MLPVNRTTYLEQGEIGVPITMTFYDEEKELIDLTNWSVRMIARRTGEAKIIDVDMEPNPDQELYTGQATYHTIAGDSVHAVGDYPLKSILTHPDGRVWKYPKRANGEWATLVIQKTIDES